jgi:hypothetical protein
MSNNVGFQIVCTNCGCLSINVKEPLKAAREDIVYCGECGISRGTIGALRDLSVRQYLDIAISTPSAAPPVTGTANDRQPVKAISKRYDELRRLRQQVEIAEWLAGQSNSSAVIGPIRRRSARYIGFRPSPHTATVIPEDRGLKRPS